MSPNPAADPTTAPSGLPPDLFDRTTVLSLLSTVALVLAALALARRVLPPARAQTLSLSPPVTRFLFVWHAADALCHIVLEGSFLYHCFFSVVPARDAVVAARPVRPTPYNFLGRGQAHADEFVYGAQAGGGNPFAQLWMVYARADRRWAGVDLGVVSLELLTVFFDGPLAVYVCYCLARQDPRAYVWMIVLATAELYGDFMTFCPEWLSGNANLDGSNFVYLYVYLAFFNLIWVVIPLYAACVSVREICAALALAPKKYKTR